MELRQLHQFVAVAELRSFRRAAERLHMAQPPLSQAIRRLERELGAALFTRTSRSVDLTEAGKAFLVEARNVLSNAETAVLAAQQAAQGRVGRVRIGFTAPWAYDVFLRAVAAFRRQYEGVTLTLREGTSSEQVPLLLEGGLDVGFLRLPHGHPVEGLRLLPLREDALCVVLPPTHRLAGSRKLSLSRLQRESFVLPPLSGEHGREEFCLRSQIGRLCAESGFAPRVAQEASRMETIVRLAGAGLGIALVPAWTRRQWPSPAVYVRLDSRSTLARLTLAAAWSPQSQSPALEHFVEAIRRVAKK